jgi:alpha-mannosidase
VWADAAFGPVRRVPLAVHPDDAAMESPVPTAPLHRYVSLWGVRGGTTVYCDGLAEYEAMADGAVAVTLLRAVGELSRADLPERPGHAGWPVPTPMAQVPGPFGALLAVMPHGPRTPATVDAVERAADDVLCPLGGGTLLSATATPAPTAGAELSGTGLACSALTASESGDWMVARCVNLLAQPVEGVWRFGSPPPTEARLARLDETPLEPLDVRGGAVSFTAPPRGVVTILVR